MLQQSVNHAHVTCLSKVKGQQVRSGRNCRCGPIPNESVAFSVWYILNRNNLNVGQRAISVVHRILVFDVDKFVVEKIT